MKIKKNIKKFIWVGLFSSVLLAAGCSANEKTTAENKEKEKEAVKTEEVQTETTSAINLTNYAPPSMENVPDGPLGESIKLGFKLMNETNTALPDNVGNELSCSSCHGKAGTDTTSPLTGVTAAYPAFNPRAGKVLTIEDRINGCFKRSMNGKPLEAKSDEMHAMVSYLTYISKDVPVGMVERPWVVKNSMKDVPKSNLANGEALYQKSCSQCHGADGSGTGPNSGPALWGEKSFNIGAGMGRISTAAGYIQRNMPLGEMGGVKQGTLTNQQAADVAGFILSKERPDFADKANDWPLGGAPADVPYELKSNVKK